MSDTARRTFWADVAILVIVSWCQTAGAYSVPVRCFPFISRVGGFKMSALFYGVVVGFFVVGAPPTLQFFGCLFGGVGV